MKRTVLIMSAILLAVGAADAQDTIRYPDTCYMYNPFEIDNYWGTTIYHHFSNHHNLSARTYDDAFLSDSARSALLDLGYELLQDPLTSNYWWVPPGNHPAIGNFDEYVAQGQTWIYGIAATTGGVVGTQILENSGRYLDSIYTLADILNINYFKDSVFVLYAYLFGVSNGEVYCIDSVKWIPHNNPYRFFEYKQYPPSGFESIPYPPVVTYSYEFYFDKPVSVADTFLIGVRFPHVYSLASFNSRWNEVESSCKNPQWRYQNINDREPRLIDFCNHHARIPAQWGGFFPILTPRDTTRCYPVQDVCMVQATDSSVMLEWHGGNATQWEVEYAEADGMTVYTVTTTTPRVTLTGLRPTTTYLAHVRGRCAGETDYGEWSPLIEARTTDHQPDTDTVQGPDTVAIDIVGLLTRLAPNPASGLVTVRSSYSLSHVAVYDVRGHMVLEKKAADNAATFDVGNLPKGVYVVSVRTVAGTTTKRLLVE